MPSSSLTPPGASVVPIDIFLYLCAHFDRIYSFLELRLLNKHFRDLIKTHEHSIAAHIIEEYFAFEAKIFPPGNTYRGYRHRPNGGWEPRGRAAYEESCRHQRLCFIPNTYEYVNFLERRSQAIETFESMVVERTGMSRTGAYRNCAILWGLVEGNWWSLALTAFLTLPKETQWAFAMFLDELMEHFLRRRGWPVACSFLGHHDEDGDLYNHNNNYAATPMVDPAEQLPDNVTCEELEWLGVPEVYVKWMFLTHGVWKMQSCIEGNYDDFPQVYNLWRNDMKLELHNDEFGGHFEVRFPVHYPPTDDIRCGQTHSDPIKALYVALWLPEGASLPSDWTERLNNGRPTTIFSRAAYWNHKRWFYDAGNQRWFCQRGTFYGDWTEFEFDISGLFESEED